jgi:hypothetical protein
MVRATRRRSPTMAKPPRARQRRVDTGSSSSTSGSNSRAAVGFSTTCPANRSRTIPSWKDSRGNPPSRQHAQPRESEPRGRSARGAEASEVQVAGRTARSLLLTSRRFRSRFSYLRPPTAQATMATAASARVNEDHGLRDAEVVTDRHLAVAVDEACILVNLLQCHPPPTVLVSRNQVAIERAEDRGLARRSCSLTTNDRPTTIRI